MKTKKKAAGLEQHAAPGEAAARIRGIDIARQNVERFMYDTIESVAKEIGLTRKNGEGQWGYKIAEGVFVRPKHR